jgi:hypothetical protein
VVILDTCRLCHGATLPAFSKILAGKYDVRFTVCTQCGSMQTEPAYWLKEIYSDPRPIADVGIVQRSIDLAMTTHVLLNAFKISPDAICIDWGGGNGLFTRMMRDRGYNFYSHEPYTENFYVPFHGSDALNELQSVVITAFEVLEHLPDPGANLASMFAASPDICIATTELYTGQGNDWWYLAAETGQHVFFYSPKALLMIAETRGYRLISGGGLHVFLRERPMRAAYGESHVNIARALLADQRYLFQEKIRYMLQHLASPYRHVQSDHDSILARLRAGHVPSPHRAR